ncbi:MAG: hypothetical protein P4L71_09585 [Acetobacteraceae bacterium]|nr:hypothetical protein [Acetobacteraceae bacterium]
MLHAIGRWGAQSEAHGNLLVLLIVIGLALLVGASILVLAQIMLPVGMRPL